MLASTGGAPKLFKSFPRFELFRQFPLKWFLCWVVAPNFPIMAMWPIGGPAMATSMFVGGVIALLVSQRETLAIRILGVIAVYALNVSVYISTSFNIAVANLLSVPQYFNELHPFRSPEYSIALLVMLAALVVTLRFAARKPSLNSRGSLLMALAGISAIANIDTVATAGTRGSYNASAPAGAPVDSAVLQTGIAPDRVAARNLVIVLVESWGVPANAFDRELNNAVWQPERWSGRYEVSSGTTAYFGSTTGAEIRELCGVWADHIGFDFETSSCLPKKFREAGFATHALHGFGGEFFDRRSWYPIIGFDHVKFRDELVAGGAGLCGGVFPGACDENVPREIGNMLRRSTQKRNLVYWLTLNSHLPVPSSRSLGTDPCKLGTAEWREQYPMLCRTYQVHQRLSNSLTAEIMREDFPESDILIVGDHMPPFFQRTIRTRYDSARVPYYFLRHRGAMARKAVMAEEEDQARLEGGAG